jgi:hypothetical protein
VGPTATSLRSTLPANLYFRERRLGWAALLFHHTTRAARVPGSAAAAGRRIRVARPPRPDSESGLLRSKMRTGVLVRSNPWGQSGEVR